MRYFRSYLILLVMSYVLKKGVRFLPLRWQHLSNRVIQMPFVTEILTLLLNGSPLKKRR